jgi:pilus assembly protein CpaC
VIKQMEKIPGLGDIPLFGKLFQSHSFTKSKSELLVVVTPRIVQPLTAANVPAGPVFPVPFLEPAKPEEPKSKKK